jgi:hypothetical protein
MGGSLLEKQLGPTSTRCRECWGTAPLARSDDFFDGRSTRVRVVNVSLAGDDLIIAGEDINFRVPFTEVIVDERLGRAPRRLRLKDGTFCEVRDLDALDTLLASTAHRDGWVDRMQRHLQFVLFSIVACVALAS